MRFVLSILITGLLASAQAPKKVQVKPGGKPTVGGPAATTPAAEPKDAPLDMKKVEAMIRHIEGWTSQLQIKFDNKPSTYLPGFTEIAATVIYNGQEVLQRQFFASKDGKVIRGSVHDINQHPFQADLDKIKTELQPSFGTPGAKVVIAIYSDFQCPACRQEAKEIRDNLMKEFPTEARVYYKDFPLTLLHPWSMTAAIAGKCVFRMNPSAFWEYHDWIFDKQAEITNDNIQSKIVEWASSKGLDTLQLTRCIESRATEKDVRASIAEGLSLGIDRTPTVFVNGRKIEATAWQQLANLIRYELDYQKTAVNPAGEKCCEVQIPGMVKQK